MAGLFGNQLASFIMRLYSLNVLYAVLGALFLVEMIILIIWAKFISHPVWETKDNAVCADCAITCKGYRVVEWLGYDRKDDPNPQFRCESCKDVKLLQVKERVRIGK
jgi:hypothetical protein